MAYVIMYTKLVIDLLTIRLLWSFEMRTKTKKEKRKFDATVYSVKRQGNRHKKKHCTYKTKNIIKTPPQQITNSIDFLYICHLISHHWLPL